MLSSSIYTDLAETILLTKWIFTGGVSREYDISGNGNNLYPTAYNTNVRGFCPDGSTYMLDNGWALWQKSGSTDIYIPNGGQTTTPVAGYTLTKNYEGSLTKINMCPCLIGFNEMSSAATALEIFTTLFESD